MEGGGEPRPQGLADNDESTGEGQVPAQYLMYQQQMQQQQQLQEQQFQHFQQQQQQQIQQQMHMQQQQPQGSFGTPDSKVRDLVK